MAKKRSRDDDTGTAEQEDGKQKPGGSCEAGSRRKDMASIARRRAAHFANFNADDDTSDNNVHVGSDQARTLGPWSSAIELVNAREKAQHDRQAKLQGIKGTTEEGHAEDEAEWQPRRDPSLGPHPQESVRSLFETCLDVLTTYVDCVESLWGVPDVIKVRLATSVCRRRKMSPEVARLFTVGSPAEVLLPDCTQLDAVVMKELVQQVATDRLQRLELGFCGRGFGDEAAALMAAAGPLRALEVLALEGAYRLSDAGLENALSATPSLTSLALPQSSRLSGVLLDKLPALAPGLTHLNLADCRGIGADSLVAVLPRMSAMRTLKLDFIPEVDDAVLAAMESLPKLRELSIRCCQSVTDAGLTALAATRGPVLEVLRLDECGGNVTDRGVEALASQCRALRVFSARRCTRLGDKALAGLLRAGTVRHLTLSGVTGVGPAVAGALASCCQQTLEYLDVSFCRKLPDHCLGPVLDRCTHLRRLVIFGCSQLSPRSLYGHFNSELVIDGVHTKIGLDQLVASAATQGRPVTAAAASPPVPANELSGR
ncbi:hypothetical protein Vretimale_462 [Volvox reticuliferus]|uniref:F-box/LRR-repeat protein 15-like leucin rich repeat domain-containing protein n=1 Tax=Volvox reticuliferus TaxID=1737510 RepID=A0A8J4D255_9CHLO|nr:hypothetical protein Vretifemale_2549 [Volvox reticuliferus]GIL94190.1 hypothetical protein Vretimale_462 [Volvox reticuliferus]